MLVIIGGVRSMGGGDGAVAVLALMVLARAAIRAGVDPDAERVAKPPGPAACGRRGRRQPSAHGL
eukprot:CAMPEP_0198594418 /NCGR_PEP_ID=MMETSP1462-20131121/140600_1 /TAXON_ID=1333877 /ORGANISM="Brandtodinium nutriculum, Strain RCC3387" /LENGTH=64 /DNA_ID=CAMNT_0044326035 /DNA_START=284 /DNA_END=474 /DNA_ORIENTATION=+